ncbi:MAG: tetratricopeptide repeat-containing sulfotransferase family protein [Chromatiaceae bacterium]|jgi:tetratricopeptide (TPR) repeat protein
MSSEALLSSFLQLLPQVYQALRQQQFQAVETFLQRHQVDHPQWRVLALELALSSGNDAGVVPIFTDICRRIDEQAGAALRLAQHYVATRRRLECRQMLALVAEAPIQDAGFYRAVAAVYSALDDPSAALPWLEQAVSWSPQDAALRFDLALAQFFLNQMIAAQQNLALVLEQLPLAGNVLHLRSATRSASDEDNHIADLQQRLAQRALRPQDAVGAGYALAKELEDIGDYAAAFVALRQAATQKRQQLRYDARSEFATFAAMRQHFNAAFFAKARSVPTLAATSSLKPIFILGMPRTGTTLVERILGQHPDVISIGEFPDFPQEVGLAAQQVPGVGSLVEAALQIDYPALGARYLQQAAAMAQGKPIFVDKLPFNFIYCGLIKKALPQARIIHLVRDPLDTCFAIYKTLFNQVYSFSYQLDELADYFIEYKKLMAHWHQVLPGQILDVHYEQVVAEPESQAKRILDWCDLPWQQDLLAFHQAKSASTTASAAQVRQPIHQKSVQKWRQFANELTPVRERLFAAGLIDANGDPV